MIDVDDIIKLLNDMVKLDPISTTKLFESRVDCNAAMAEHPTIKVNYEGGKDKVGILGVLNGLFKEEYGPIVAVCSDTPIIVTHAGVNTVHSDTIIRFERAPKGEA